MHIDSVVIRKKKTKTKTGIVFAINAGNKIPQIFTRTPD